MQNLFFPYIQKSPDCGGRGLIAITTSLRQFPILNLNGTERFTLFTGFPDKQDGTFPLNNLLYIASYTMMQVLPFFQNLLCSMGKEYNKPIFYKMILLIHLLKLFLYLPVIDQGLLFVRNIIQDRKSVV